MSGTTSMRASIARLPPEVVELVVAFSDVNVCTALRHLPALRRVLTAYKQGANWSLSYEKSAVATIVASRWSVGVQTLIDLDFRSVTEHRGSCNGIVLPVTAIRKMFQWPSWRSVLPDLAYNRIAAGLDVADLLNCGIEFNTHFVETLGNLMIEHGGGIDQLRGMCREFGQFNSESDLAWVFLRGAIRYERLDLVQYLDGVAPEAVQEQQSVLEAAASAGNMHVLKYIYERVCYQPTHQVFYQAAMAGHEDAARWLYDRRSTGMRWRHAIPLIEHGKIGFLQQLYQSGQLPELTLQDVDRSAVTAVKNDHLIALQWLHSVDNSFCRASWLENATPSVSLATLQWVTQNAVDSPSSILLCRAAAAGRQDLVEWICDTLPDCRAVAAVGDAAGAGHYELAQWLAATLGVPLPAYCPTPQQLQQAAQNGRLDVFRWVDCHCQLPVAPSLLMAAIDGRNLAIAQLLHRRSSEVPFSDVMLIRACGGGNLELVQWIFSILPTTVKPEGAFREAAKHGHLRVVEWLHRNTDLPCTAEAMDCAASHGLVDVLRFLHQHRREGCTHYAMDQAAGGGYIYALEFLHQHRRERCSHLALYWAVDRGLNQTAHWLLERYPRHLSPQVVYRAAEGGQMQILQYIHAIPNAPFTADAMVQAARHGRLEVVRFLHESRPEPCKTTAMADALLGGHVGVAKFLCEHKYPICPATDIPAAPQYAQDWLQDVHKL